MTDPNPQDQPKRDTNWRMSFIEDLLGRAGELGMTTEDIENMMRAAGWTGRRQTIDRDLDALQPAFIEERDGRWFLAPDAAKKPAAPPDAIHWAVEVWEPDGYGDPQPRLVDYQVREEAARAVARNGRLRLFRRGYWQDSDGAQSYGAWREAPLGAPGELEED